MTVSFAPVARTLAVLAAVALAPAVAAAADAVSTAPRPPAPAGDAAINPGGHFKECHGFIRHISDVNIKAHCIDGRPSDQSFLYLPKYANLKDGKSVQTKNLHPDTPVLILYTQTLGVKKAYKIIVNDADGNAVYGVRG